MDKTILKKIVGSNQIFTKTRKHAAGFVILFLGLIGIFTHSLINAGEKKWQAVNHDKTNFPLVGKHRTVACSECHIKGLLRGTPTECESCHWSRRQDDPYNLQLGIHCTECHTPTDWKKIKAGSWDHSVDTGYILQGSHKTLDCNQCHRGRILSANRQDCIDCHREDYNNVRDPSHTQGQFPEDCLICHTKTGWQGITFNHLYFPLYGRHKTAACSECHGNGVYSGLPSDCIDCHRDEYNQTSNPNHLQTGYSSDCDHCHGTSANSWLGARIDHNQFWSLRGAHKSLDCQACHSGGYNISGECISCHLDDYNNTRNPNHKEVGFHTDCQVCHPAEAGSWTIAVYGNHLLPLSAGPHRQLSCSDCHTKGNYFDFSCIHCHDGGKTRMKTIHKNVAGFTWHSRACYSCHPLGHK